MGIDDEKGEKMTMTVQRVDELVVIEFNGKEVKYLALDCEDAETVGRAILREVNAIKQSVN